MADEYIVEVIGGATITRMHEGGASGAVMPIVSMRQAKLALMQAGRLGAVEAAINSLPETQRTEALINWTSATLIERNHPMVALIATAAGMSESDIDSLFSAAASIV
jgi:hypothetical protein